jgi:hypothetical protein
MTKSPLTGGLFCDIFARTSVHSNDQIRSSKASPVKRLEIGWHPVLRDGPKFGILAARCIDPATFRSPDRSPLHLRRLFNAEMIEDRDRQIEQARTRFQGSVGQQHAGYGASPCSERRSIPPHCRPADPQAPCRSRCPTRRGSLSHSRRSDRARPRHACRDRHLRGLASRASGSNA